MTSFLLDTHTFIWLTENDPNLPNNLREGIDFAPEKLEPVQFFD